MHIPFRNFTCSKRAQGTSGHWILTMKLQRLHSNGGDEVRNWDGNHKLILLTWQAACPRLPPNTALSSATEVRKIPREEKTQFIINFGSKEGHNRHRTHTICLILFWCHYCMRQQSCNLHAWLFIGFPRDLHYNVFYLASFVISFRTCPFHWCFGNIFCDDSEWQWWHKRIVWQLVVSDTLTLPDRKERQTHSVANLIMRLLCSLRDLNKHICADEWTWKHAVH